MQAVGLAMAVVLVAVVLVAVVVVLVARADLTGQVSVAVVVADSAGHQTG